MKINCIVVGLIVALCVFSAFAGKTLTIERGKTQSVEPGFKVEKFKVDGAKECVVVDVGDDGVARITGAAKGACSVKLLGPGGMDALYEISVVENDLARIQKSLELELEGVSGIEIVRNDEKLLVRGEVNSPSEWKKLNNVLKDGTYGSLVKNNANFSVQADTVRDFYRQLRASHFSITDKLEEAKDGTLFVKYENNMVLIEGTVYSADDVRRLKGILNAQATWLHVDDGKPILEAEAWKPICRMNVGIDHRLLHMDVVMISYKENASENYGSEDNRPDIKMTFSSLLDLVGGHAKNDTFQIDANLVSVLDFMKRNDIARESVGGYMRFRCNDDAAANLHIGGTLKVKMQSATAEGVPTQNFEDIPYGFILDKKSATLMSDSLVHVAFDISQKTPTAINGNYEEGYEVKENTYNPQIDCPLGKTVVIGGYRSLLQKTLAPSGTPIFRNVPVLKWFFAGEGDSTEEMKLMMLVSVREVRPDEPEQQNAKLPYETTKNLTTEIEINNNDRLETRRKKAEKWHGWLYWLNWFTP